MASWLVTVEDCEQNLPEKSKNILRILKKSIIDMFTSTGTKDVSELPKLQ